MKNNKNPDQLHNRNLQLHNRNLQLHNENLQLHNENLHDEIVIHNPITTVLNNQVAFENNVLRSFQKLTLIEKKLFILAASKLKVGLSKDKTFYPLLTTFFERTVTVTAKEFSTFTNVNIRESYYSLNKAANNLLDKKSSYDYLTPEQENRTIKYNWLESIDYPKNSGSVEITFSTLLMQKALQVYQNFTTYYLHEIFNLTSYYALRLHEIFSSYKPQKSFTPINKNFDFVELKIMLGVPQTYTWTMFKQHVLNPSVIQLQDNALWKISFRTVRTGRKITGVKFTLTRQLT